MRYLFFLLCLLTALLSAQPTPEHHLPLAYATDLLAIDVADNDRGFAAGTCGYLLATTNGQDWALTNSPTTDDITHLACRPGTNCQQVFFVANQTLYRSLDGGASWTSSAIPGNGTTQGIVFTGDEQTVVISRNVTTLTYSPDNGVTFEQVSMGAAPATLTQFVTPQRGFFFSNMTDLITTADGGQTWQNLYDHEEGIRQMSFVDELIGYMYNASGIVFKTTDGGNTWAEVGTYADIRFLVTAMTAYSDSEIELVTSRGVHRSTDGGATFTELLNINSNSNKFSDVRVEDIVRRGNEYWIAGLNTSILYTDDLMTVNHQLGPDRTPFNSLAISGDNIIALTSQDGIVRSTDGGQTFADPGLEMFEVLGTNIEFLQDGRVIVTGNGSAFVSEDNGSSFSNYQLPAGSPSVSFAKFKQLDNGRMIFVAADGVCAYSDDNGDTWSFSDHGLVESPSGLSVAGSVVGVTNRDGIAVSHDGGTTWPVQIPHAENVGQQPAFFVVDSSTWIVSTFPSGTLYHTADGGANWTTLSVRAVDIVSDGNGRLYGINGNDIVFSDHQGVSWESATDVFCSPFGLAFVDLAYDPVGQRLFAAGRGRRLFSVDVSDVVADTRDVLLPEPLRVFPNPSSGAVSVTMPEGNANERVSVQLLSATGRVVWQRNMVAGPRLDLELEAQPAGLYYLRVAGQGWIRTGRVVLRK